MNIQPRDAFNATGAYRHTYAAADVFDDGSWPYVLIDCASGTKRISEGGQLPDDTIYHDNYTAYQEGMSRLVTYKK